MITDGAATDAAADDAPVAGADVTGADRPADAPAPRTWRRDLLIVGGLTALVVLPLLVALVALRTPRWYPLLDLAMTELRVRDVGTAHTPLVGLVGRLTSGGNQGSHPGPISFWALAPVYRALGGSSWSLLVGVVALNSTAVALSIWIGLRRGGVRLAVGLAAGLAVLVHLYGTQVLTEPWNPYLPVMWWPLLLLALWAVLCDDLAMLPVAVVAGSFGLQTHISYLGQVGGFVALALVALVVALRRRDDPQERRRLVRWALAAAALGVVLWLPPLIQQVTGDPGNLTVVAEHFRDADEAPVGPRRALDLIAVQLDPWRLATGDQALTGSVLPGAALLAAWAVSVVGTWRLPRPPAGTANETAGATAGETTNETAGATASGPTSGPATGATERRRGPALRGTLLRLHAVLGVALLFGVVSASRILGFLWNYLTLWAWGTTTLIIVATAWSALAWAAHARPAARPALAGAATVGAGAVLVAWSAGFALAARDAEPTQHRVSQAVGDLATPVVAALDEGAVVPAGPDGRYRVTWTDGTYIGSPGYGLLDELERRGYDVGVAPPQGPGAVEHRVLDVADADGDIHVSVGPDIATWQGRDDAEMIAYVDPRTDAERARFAQVRADTVAELRALGREDAVPLVDRAPFMLYLDESLPEATRDRLSPLADIGQPIAVFMTADPAG